MATRTQVITSNAQSYCSPTTTGILAVRDQQYPNYLSSLPLDVLLEVFSYLGPPDLLQLARTSKCLRIHFMDRAVSEGIWERSRSQTEGLPDIPDGLSEPAFADLLFYDHCHGCDHTDIKGIIPCYSWLVQYCHHCLRRVCKEYDSQLIKEILNGYPVDDYYLVNVVQITEWYGPPRTVTYYNPAELEEFRDQWSKLRTNDGKQQYLRDWREFLHRREVFKLSVTIWKKKLRRHEEALKLERLGAILQRLRQEGWNNEVRRMDKQTDLKDMIRLDKLWKARQLTEEDWQSTRSQAIEFMEVVRHRLIARERVALLKSRLGYLESTVDLYHRSERDAPDREDRINITATDCALVPEIRAIIEDQSDDASEESIMTKVKDILPEVNARWVKCCRDAFTALFRQAVGVDSEAAKAPDPLALALASFSCQGASCSKCSQYAAYRWPGVAEHRFPRSLYTVQGRTLYEQAVAQWERGGGVCKLECVAARYMVNNLAVSRNVIKACGEDPETATYDDMEECTVRLRCRLCATPEEQQAFNWKVAISHYILKHLENRAETKTTVEGVYGYWERLPEVISLTVRRLEDARERANRCRKLEEAMLKFISNFFEPKPDYPEPITIYASTPQRKSSTLYRRALTDGTAFFASLEEMRL